MKMPTCRTQSIKHWFSLHGFPGVRLAYCARGCGVANPKWDDNRCVVRAPGDEPCGLTQAEHTDEVWHGFERIQRPRRIKPTPEEALRP